MTMKRASAFLLRILKRYLKYERERYSKASGVRSPADRL
jgi:hypothetical protein